MPPNPWSPTSNSQYLSTVLNDSPSAPTPSHAASANTPPRARQSSTLFTAQPQQTTITPAQRSAQARGKSPTSHRRSAESYAERERRNEAAAILDSQELLLWYAASRHESVSQTRRWFQNVVFGVPQDERVWKEEWEVRSREDMCAGRSPKGKGRDAGGVGKSPKGKGRAGGTPKKRFESGGPSVVFGEESGEGEQVGGV